jgi:HD-like signal output (HDOD) protein
VVSLDVILKSSRAVPVAPEVLPKLQSKLLDVDTDVADLAALIKLDAGLASNVLRAANSAYYSRGSPVASIEDGVSLIGYQETLRLVARCSYGTVMRGELTCYGVRGEALWEGAVLTAIAMEQLCRLTRLEVSEGYVTGLLHSLGMVAINDYLTRSGKGALRAPAGPGEQVVEWEVATLGQHRGDVGAAMMRQWNFATRMVLAVERQFEPNPRSEDGLLSSVLPLAVTIAEFLHEDAADENRVPPVFDPVRADHAHLDRRMLVDALATVRTEWLQARESLL